MEETTLTELEQALTDNYGGYTLLDNGVYYAKASNGDEIFVPSNTSGAIDLYAYFPGAGGSGQQLNDATRGTYVGNNDARYVWCQYHGDNPPSYVTVVSRASSDGNNMLATADQFFDQANLTPSRVVMSNFSASGATGIARANQYLIDHPDIDLRVVCMDPYSYAYNSSQNGALAEQNIPLIFVGASRNRDLAINYARTGLNAYYLNPSGVPSGSHLAYNDDGVNNLIPYLFGETNELGQTSTTNHECAYQLYIIGEDGKPVLLENYDDILLTPAYIDPSTIQAVDVSGYTNVDDEFTVTVEDSPVVDRYSYLKNLKRYTIPSTMISSDYQYVVNSMNAIKDNISKSNFLQGLKTQSFRSTSGIPGNIFGYINAYYEVMGQLLQSLNLEADSVISIAQAMSDMDADLASGAQTLGTLTESPITGAARWSSIPDHSASILLYQDMGEGNVYNLTAADLDRLFAHWAEMKNNPNSRIIGMGSAFIAASEATGLNPLALVGICGHETGRGGNGNPANWIENNNFFGIKYGNDGYWGHTRLYDNPEDGVLAGAQRIRGFYYDGRGDRSIYAIDADGYDGYAGASNYSSSIASIMEESLNYIIETSDGTETVPLVEPIALQDPGHPEITPVEPEPITPVQPVRPADPVVVPPTEPTQPVTPVTPTEPTQPVTPTQPTQPVTPTQPTQPVTPTPTPTPVEPEPTPTPTPVEPEPVEPEPIIEPTPVEPEPIEPAPVEPTPVTPTPIRPTPIEPTPGPFEPIEPEITPEPVTPIEPDPITPIEPDPIIPIEPEPIEPEPVEPEHIEPAPVEPEPQSDDSVLKTVATVAGIGAAVGVGAFTANAIVKNKEEKDEYYDRD